MKDSGISRVVAVLWSQILKTAKKDTFDRWSIVSLLSNVFRVLKAASEALKRPFCRPNKGGYEF
jgi:hypothetical protein